jgi:hypothetical protein
MLNFRVKEHEASAIDAAAKRKGLNRSDFIRKALIVAIGEDEVKRFAEIAPAKNVSPKCLDGDYKSCKTATWSRTVTGVRQCNECGLKSA